jgi:hypothetical protein
MLKFLKKHFIFLIMGQRISLTLNMRGKYGSFWKLAIKKKKKKFDGSQKTIGFKAFFLKGSMALHFVACNGADARSEYGRRERRSAEVGKRRRSGGVATRARHRPPPRVHSLGTLPLPSLSSGYTISLLRA